jgi:hypothetical protein
MLARPLGGSWGKSTAYFRASDAEGDLKIEEQRFERLGRDRGIPGSDRLGSSTLAKVGMPVTREGRFVYASPEELTNWVGTERGKKEPVHIASESEDLLGNLKQGLSYVRLQKEKRKP